MIGYKAGKLTVLSRAGVGLSGEALWECKCSCGGRVVVGGIALRKNLVWHCGCEKHHRDFQNLKDKRFGSLIVIKENYSDKGKTYWDCICDCGNSYLALGGSLTCGNVKSCGCMTSFGETSITNILEKNNIKFIREKTFPHCVYKTKLKFDFFLPDYGLVIEYDGEQHYRESGWHQKVPLSVVKDRDKTKDEFCLDSDIILIRIPYTETDRIKEILEDNLLISLR